MKVASGMPMAHGRPAMTDDLPTRPWFEVLYLGLSSQLSRDLSAVCPRRKNYLWVRGIDLLAYRTASIKTQLVNPGLSLKGKPTAVSHHVEASREHRPTGLQVLALMG